MDATAIDWTPGARAVLAAASELFYAHGLHAVGVEAVAERAGVTKKTLYDRFGSKERLVTEYLAARDRRWRHLVAERLDAAGPSAAEQLDALFTAAREWARAEGFNGCAMLNAHAELGAGEHPAREVVAGQKRWTLELFRGIAERSGAPRPEQLARALLLLHEGAVVSHGVGVVDDAFEAARLAALALLPGTP
ncbi:TetR/AcrR family transcriptional regulator [Kineococcus indalonis]|uniref:TetR/AcrR family transcriptional regulator n=1 Tax=Kineococcus indalonis TaxID=2696566 RepID=UPI002B1BE4DB|nr:helix-turn-helix domain-containing protein [Kineococcus indalonis]